jgi:glycosyltransferase involved in cell wall biosynthesis
MVNEYREADMVTLISTKEGFGLPIVEAQATGRSVVTSSTSSMPEVAGEGAILVDPYSSRSIRDGIKTVIENSEYREAIIRKGFENIGRFSPEKIASQYASLYRKLSITKESQ